MNAGTSWNGKWQVVLGWALLLPWLAHGQSIRLLDTSSEPPLHPTAIVVDYKHKQYPLVGARGQTPQIEVDGKSVGINTDRAYFPTRAGRFAPGSITIKNIQGGGSKRDLVWRYSDGSEVSGGTLSSRSDFFATLVPTIAYDDSYVAVLIYNKDFVTGQSDQLSCRIVFENIGRLEANAEKKINVRFPYLGDDASKLGWFPLIFSHGFEVQSNMSEFAAHFFRRMEAADHDRAVAAYRQKYQEGNHPVGFYMRIPPILPTDGDLSSTHDSVVKTSFMVNEDGKVESLQIEGKVPAPMHLAIQRALQGWLFMPQIKDGRAVRTMIRMPIELESAAEPAAVKP